MSEVVKIKDASFAYGDNYIFKDLSLSINKGEIFCIIGPNGCGKTTLIENIMGIHSLNSGKIEVYGQDILNIKPRLRARKLSYIPQNTKKTFPFTVEDIVLMGRTHNIDMFSSPSREDKEAVLYALEKVRALDLKDKLFTQLSGGETKLVLIARALAQDSDIIIMDEPTAHLDFKNELLLLELIQEIMNEDLTIIMTTHFPNHGYYFEASGLNTRLGLMKEGHFTKIGQPSDLLTEENLLNIYGIESKILSYQADNIDRKQILALKIQRSRDNFE